VRHTIRNFQSIDKRCSARLGFGLWEFVLPGAIMFPTGAHRLNKITHPLRTGECCCAWQRSLQRSLHCRHLLIDNEFHSAVIDDDKII
jgi:hypothetical protein